MRRTVHSLWLQLSPLLGYRLITPRPKVLSPQDYCGNHPPNSGVCMDHKESGMDWKSLKPLLTKVVKGSLQYESPTTEIQHGGSPALQAAPSKCNSRVSIEHERWGNNWKFKTTCRQSNKGGLIPMDLPSLKHARNLAIFPTFRCYTLKVAGNKPNRKD